MPSKSPFWLIIIALTGACGVAYGQGFTRKTYHDLEKKKIKEVYLVKDTIRNVAHGRYTSYFVNGGVESKGQFENNETTGVWEFFFETGKLKMRGILFKSANYGMWEYFYEGSGQKSMEGIINGKNREGEWKSYYENGHVKEVGGYKENRHIGLWKSYFEDGALKGEIVYTDDAGYYTEYYHSGKPQSEGTRAGTRNTGHWKFYREDGSLESEGDYVSGKKHGPWKRYFANSVVAAKGNYANDEPVGPWEYFYESGGLQSSGAYVTGKKDGYWKTLNSNGTLKSEVAFTKGSGEYREYHPNGSLKVKGPIRDGKRQGKWEFFLPDGTREGECDYNYDKGTFYGYYPTGELQTKGTLEGELKTGTWEIYEKDGKLSGYYKPFYDDRKLGKEIVALATTSSARKGRNKSQGFRYFHEKGNEFHGVIMSTNPVWTAVGRIPLGVEFYIEERLGHEFEFLGIRDPFFTADTEITPGKLFQRGYSISIKQKFYNGMKVGMWYFGHEIRFTNLGHFVNDPVYKFTFNAVEQRIEWGPMLGYRIMRRNNASGFTVDTFASFNIGYRGFDIDPMFATYFEPLDRDKFSKTFHIGLNFGNVFSYR